MGSEIELKYRLRDAAQISEILSHPFIRNALAAEPKIINTDSVYYDTPDRALGKRRIALRRRVENNRLLFTVKTPGISQDEFSQRGEWQVYAGSLEEALSGLRDAGAPAELFEILESDRLIPCARTVFTRHLAPLTLGAELCLDTGFLGNLEFSELELELTHGEVAQMRDFGERCAQLFSLTPERLSKFHRAQLSLCGKEE